MDTQGHHESFPSGTLTGEGSAAPFPFWITVMNLPCDYVQAEKNGGVERLRSGVGHGVCGFLYIPFDMCPLISFFLHRYRNI